MDLSASIRNKLGHNYHELTDLEKLYYRLVIRPTLSADHRFFFEGALDIIGQMYLAERQALFNAIIQFKPRRCFEVGTFTGGGSTFFLASAFEKIGAGKVITLEPHPALFSLATAAYRTYLPHLLDHVEFIKGGDVEAFVPHIDPAEGVDAFFLDGAENADQTLAQYRFFQPHLHSGTVMMAHDWDTDKMASVRPRVESDPQWETLLALDPPYSVGLVVLRRR
ncbi:MAG: class I SAM-dependent methyltransferase [Desulfobacterales bacterium]|nr:class I SAM-dependent methyltransferase [Desulfobacterales bacterium]